MGARRMNEQIIVKCKHRDYELIRAWALPTVLILQRGQWGKVASMRQFNVYETERIKFEDNPEIKGVYDAESTAWDLDKLFLLLHRYCDEVAADDAE
jgi:hypothetical protein